MYVCDLDTPWNSHKVTSTAYPVSALEWDLEGKQLLVATTVGDVSVYGQKDFLLNDWTCLYSANFPGEHIIQGAFFHNGRRVVAMDKKSDAVIPEKIQMLRFSPTLKGFGGVACEGVLVVTASGLICVAVSPGGDSRTALVATEGLRPHRDHVTAAAICYKGGSPVVALCCADGCVRCAAVTVTRAPPAAPALALQPLPAIHLLHEDPPAAVAWSCREDSDCLLLAGAALSLWKCSERAHPVHKVFAKGNLQSNPTAGGGQKAAADCFNTLVWQRTAVLQQEGGRAVSVCGARLPQSVPAVLLATPHAVHYKPKDSHVALISRPVTSHGAADAQAGGATPPKNTKYGPGVTPGGARCALVSCAAVSAQGGAAVLVDTHGQLHVYRLPQVWPDLLLTNPALSVQLAVSALEYAAVAGCDCLDVLLALRPGAAETVYERFTESFQRQPPAVQQYYQQSALKLRIALCRLSARLTGSGAWLTCLQTCEVVWAAASAALKLEERPDGDCEENHIEQDKLIASLEAKAEAGAELAALRVSVQRVGDIAVTALLSLSQQPHHQSHGYELWSDNGAVWLLRRVLALSRGTGRPHDAAARCLARLAAAAPALKQDLLEECASLVAQCPGPRVWEALPRVSVSAPHQKPGPHYLEYGVEPDSLRYVPEPPPYVQCETTPSLAMDSIRYMYLGGGLRPARWRGCARCGGRALAAALPARHPAHRAFDARFVSSCRCGGKWTLFTNTEMNSNDK